MIDVKVLDPLDGLDFLGSRGGQILAHWCMRNCKKKFWVGWDFVRFEDSNDAILFKLRWA